jgi:hypothetical protein
MAEWTIAGLTGSIAILSEANFRNHAAQAA